MTAATKPKYKVIGTRPVRHDGVDKVTGRAEYGADVQLTGLSTRPCSAARTRTRGSSGSTPGGPSAARRACRGHQCRLPDQGDRIAELGEGAVNMRHLSANVLAHDKVLYNGHAVAAVAADPSTSPKKR